MRSGDGGRFRALHVALLAVGFVLFVAPVALGAVGADGVERTLEAHEVAIEEGQIDYVADDHPREAISEDLGCQGGYPPHAGRICSFEDHLLHEGPDIFVARSTSSSGSLGPYTRGPYRYVQVDGGVYEPSVRVDDVDDRTDWYRYYLDIDPVAPETALDDLARDGDRFAEAVREAARTGEATAGADVFLPAHPIALEDGTYHRVVETDQREPSAWFEYGSLSGLFLQFVGLGFVVAGARRPDPWLLV